MTKKEGTQKSRTGRLSALECENWNLDEWVQSFYERGNKKVQDQSPIDIWLHFVETAGTRIAEFIRREKYQQTIESLGEAFGWLSCFIKKFDETNAIQSLSSILWTKYPGVCYACVEKIPKKDVESKNYVSCICLGMKETVGEEKRNDLLEIAQEKKPKPKTIDEWANMIKTVYQNAHSVLPISAICLHFIEEVGEVTRELFQIDELEKNNVTGEENASKLKKLEEEIADATSWIFGLLNKVDQQFEKARNYYKETVGLPALKTSKIMQDALKQFPGRKDN